MLTLDLCSILFISTVCVIIIKEKYRLEGLNCRKLTGNMMWTLQNKISEWTNFIILPLGGVTSMRYLLWRHAMLIAAVDNFRRLAWGCPMTKLCIFCGPKIANKSRPWKLILPQSPMTKIWIFLGQNICPMLLLIQPPINASLCFATHSYHQGRQF